MVLITERQPYLIDTITAAAETQLKSECLDCNSRMKICYEL